MSLYESTFIIRHDMSTQQVEQMAEAFIDIIKNNGGEVTKTEHWGLKTLAYRIKKNRKGHYVYFNIDAPSEAMQELERNMRLSEDVLRYLTVRVDEHDPEPSPMMQVRASRDDRSRRVERSSDEAGSDAKKSDAKESKAEEPKAEVSKAEESKAEESGADKAAEDSAEETETTDNAEAADDAKADDAETDETGDQT